MNEVNRIRQLASSGPNTRAGASDHELYRPIGRSPGPVIVLAVFFGISLFVPVAVLVYQSFTGASSGAFGSSRSAIESFRFIFTDSYHQGAILRTLKLSSIAAIASVVLGYAIVLSLRRRDGTMSPLAPIVVLVPLLTGPMVTVMGFMASFSKGWPGYEAVNAIRVLFGGEPGRVISTETPVLIGLIHFNLPYVMLILLPVVAHMPGHLLQVSSSLGGSPTTTFRRIVWPLTRQGVYAATIIAIVLSMSSFVYPYFLGGGRNPVLTTVVSYSMSSFAPDVAAAAAVLLVALGTTLVFVYARFFVKEQV